MTARRLAQWLVSRSAVAAARCTARALNTWRSEVPERDVRAVFAGSGFHFFRKHYYQPVPEEEDIAGDFQERRSEMPGVDLNDAAALGFLETVFPRYAEEFRAAFPLHRDEACGPERFHLINGTYMAVDAHVYYAFIRHFRPKRIVEIGGGNSSLLAGAACLRNREETGDLPRLTVVEPYPAPPLKGGFPGLSDLVERKVQEVPLDLFTSLEAGDILFIDSSHVLKAGGDVQLEYLEILPRLRPGVLVHVHDISLPKPYPRVYFETGLYWNEQYLLQAFLVHNAKAEVLWAGNHMMIRYPEKVCEVFPEFHEMRRRYPQSEPSGFWMRVRR